MSGRDVGTYRIHGTCAACHDPEEEIRGYYVNGFRVALCATCGLSFAAIIQSEVSGRPFPDVLLEVVAHQGPGVVTAIIDEAATGKGGRS